MPPPIRASSTSPPQTNSAFINQPPVSAAESDVGGQQLARLQNEDTEEVELQTARDQETPAEQKTRKRRSGTMNRNFKFPPANPPTIPPSTTDDHPTRVATPPARTLTPSNIEVPAPPPVMKDKGKGKGKQRVAEEEAQEEDEVGETVEIEL